MTNIKFLHNKTYPKNNNIYYDFLTNIKINILECEKKKRKRNIYEKN